MRINPDQIRPDMEVLEAEFSEFARLSLQDKRSFEMKWEDRLVCLDDRHARQGFEPHYTYHPAWAAGILSRTRPAKHVDISSSLLFNAVVSAFVPVDFYDFRPAALELSGLQARAGNLLDLPFETNSVGSLSCMHVVEHIGLGRYGDPLDPSADLAAIAELRRVLAVGGNLLFVVPVGRPRICFNAHRIYSYEQVASYFDGLQLMEFALVDDRGRFEVGADPSRVEGQQWGCGCWWFRKGPIA